MDLNPTDSNPVLNNQPLQTGIIRNLTVSGKNLEIFMLTEVLHSALKYIIGEVYAVL